MTDGETWLESDRRIPALFMRPALRFMRLEASSGVVLILAAVAALVWANGPFGNSYETFWGTEVKLEAGPIHLDETLRHVVNDALMTFFFFVVGLEIKREIRLGDLRDRRAAALPAIAAVGGMVVPALIYFALNAGGDAARGWGIPMATDIAFALGVVALLGSRVPAGAKLFLLALAIVDDIGAIAVIAVFYTEDLSLGWLAAAVAAYAVVYAAKRSQVRSMAFYWVAGAVVWFATFESGVHATLAGVALGWLTPTRPLHPAGEFDRRAKEILAAYPIDETTVESREHVDHEVISLATVVRESVAPLTRLEEAMHPWTSFLVVPLFALANAGVVLSGIDLGDALTDPVALGVILGLVVGKVVGITSFAAVAVRLGIGKLPTATTWRHVIGLAALGGIGFTVSLFVSGLAFGDGPTGDLAKIGIFAGSILAGVAGYLVLRSSRPATPADRTTAG